MAGQATSSGDYGALYYQSHLGCAEPYDWSTPHWQTFFRDLAGHVAALSAGPRILDVGCAKGLLVQALRERGVEAFGIDISEHAIETSHPDVRPYLSVATADSIEGRWDLVTCVEVVEHMSPPESERAIAALCSASDLVLLSSSPEDYAEPTHVNVREPAAWAASFAEQGFFRRTDVDLSFLTPWAVLFAKGRPTVRDLVHSYERYAWPMRSEVLAKRTALVDTFRKLAEAEDRAKAAAERETAATARLADVERELELSRDHARNVEARNAEILASTSWRVAKAIVTPAAKLKGRRPRL